MALITCLLTGICLIVLGMRAKIPDDAPAQTSKFSEQARRMIITGIGMAAVLLALFLLRHSRS